MNTPNKLTLLRVILVPAFVAALLIPEIPYNYIWALALFIAASITDMADGKIARKYNLITDFGKFLDPLADKILVMAALVCFNQLGWAAAWLTIVILTREFAVSGMRLAAAGSEKKAVIAASIWGKLKTASTMVSICIILVLHILEQLSVIREMGITTQEAGVVGIGFPIQLVSDVLMYITAMLTLASGVKYFYDYREFIDPRQ